MKFDGCKASVVHSKIETTITTAESMPVEEWRNDGVPPFNTSTTDVSVTELKTKVILFKVQHMQIA